MEVTDPTPVDPAMDIDHTVEEDPEEDPEEDSDPEEVVAHSPTPPPAPVSPLHSDDEEYDPILDGVATETADIPPPSPPAAAVPLVLYDWMTGMYAEGLEKAEARVAALEEQITVERQQRARAQGGRVDTSTRRMRSTMRRVEQRAIGRVHRLFPLHGPVKRRDVIRILTDAMRRARDATRVGIP